MLDTVNSDAGDSSAGKGGQQNPAQRVTKCRTVATLQRFDYILTVGAFGRSFNTLYTRLFYFDHILI